MTIVELDVLRKRAEEDLAKVNKKEGLKASEGEPFSALFGRDVLITCLFLLQDYNRNHHDSKLLTTVSHNLLILAANQGTKIDQETDEEPGKIEHENRSGPENQFRLEQLRQNGWPVKESAGQLYMRYYGSVDATPLFVVVVSEYVKTSNDWKLFEQTKDNVKAAVSWLKHYGDVDGDGFIEYQAKNRKALINQGWKDSGNSISTPEGKHPKEPIALVEVQGYAYWAYTNAAWLFEATGDFQLAHQLQNEALQLKEKFNRDFWMEEEKYFAYALDGDKKQIKDIVSNVGHLLITNILNKDKASLVAKRLMQPDLLTRYGIRTLSMNSPHFRFSETDPKIQQEAYHNGSVWPHDNALIALGFEKYGFYKEAEQIRHATLEAISELGHVELYQVSPDGKQLVPYKQAARPQTWTIGSTLLWT